MNPDGPKWGQEDSFPTHPDLADILGDTDFDFENVCFLDFLGSRISRFPGPRFPNFQKSGLGRAGPGLGRAGPGLGLGPGVPLGWAGWAYLESLKYMLLFILLALLARMGVLQ